MVSKIIWSTRALQELHDIATYIGKSSPMAAERFCMRLIAHAESLVEFPEKGRIVPEKNRPTLRELIFPPYRIVYEVQAHKEVLEIMTVWHSARGPVDI